jgi:hypothetical protein
MTAAQKAAWLNLIVIASATIVVVALYPAFGSKAFAGLSLLALCALNVLFHWGRGRRVVSDERDEHINRRAVVWAYGVLWLAFVSAALLAPLVFGQAVPVRVIQNSVWVAFMILIGVQSIAVLVQYGREASHAE